MTQGSSSPRGWEHYWRASAQAGSFAAGGVSHPAASAFWANCIEQQFITPGDRLLELAAGDGDVSRRIHASLGDSLDYCAVDYSVHALDNLRNALPGATVVAADVARLPLRQGSFDTAVSQFGVEYAGVDAIVGLTDYLADNATLCLLMHCEASSICLDNQHSLQVLDGFVASGFIESALDMFSAARRALATGQSAGYQASAARLAAVLQQVDALCMRHAGCSAARTIAQITDDVVRLHDRLEYQDIGAIMDWLQRHRAELAPYRERFETMTGAALSPDTFSHCCSEFEKQGFELRLQAPLQAEPAARPVGYALVATRQ